MPTVQWAPVVNALSNSGAMAGSLDHYQGTRDPGPSIFMLSLKFYREGSIRKMFLDQWDGLMEGVSPR